MAYFPLFVNLQHKEVLILGGGSVAFQEISQFLTFEAKIVLLADQIDQNLQILIKAYEDRVDFVQKKPSIEAISNLNCTPTLVIVTENDAKLNAEIYAYYQNKNVLVQDISSRQRCDFIFPAIIKRGDVVCGISSSGKSPHVSQFLKSLIESSLPQNISDINEHMEEIRRAVRQSISDPSKRSRTLQTIFLRLIEDDNQTSDAEIDGIIAEAEL
ncbi:MAG: bifunctional precorrin-2 dehydrogenase/sirohydrochlorin ferrochelatase [Treponema sp.]|nr:bifunctional precorrin-2 dehydrogenase/sirohydrochlorin ferrochelatase [Treponema sp.]MBP5695611.1 bifunctional precorrin-2 dehydrogenase/sirohydrochlorin ferrochelatase [Treponema sp.]